MVRALPYPLRVPLRAQPYPLRVPLRALPYPLRVPLRALTRGQAALTGPPAWRTVKASANAEG